jgi:hypothetical protein
VLADDHFGRGLPIGARRAPYGSDRDLLSRIADPGAAAGIAAVVLADRELPAGERAIFVVATATRGGVVPEARRAREGLTGGPTRPVVGDDFEDEVATLALEPLPGLLADLVEDAVERRVRDDEAAGAATVARIDDR